MCGICGVWYFERERKVSTALIEQMTHQIVHRGPDEGGALILDNVGLGFRRLSIIDVSGSHQPMTNHLGCSLVFNGEIYNYLDLRQTLGDYPFRTNGDTETILAQYNKQGKTCIQSFMGMFAFALYDAHLERFFCAVDRFGKKPFYYFLDDEKFIFASELKCILQHPNINRQLNAEALDEYLAFGCISAPHTIFQCIHKLEGGQSLQVWADGRHQLERYWTPTLYPSDTYRRESLPELAEELRALLEEAVRVRLMSEVPLGAFLSGGVDSSAIVALMAQVSNQTVKTFSIGFNEELLDETPYADVVAQHYATEHTRRIINQDVVTLLPKLAQQFDEPFADASAIPSYYVAQIAREQVTVALSGDGGDEVFGGYHRYRYVFRDKALQAWIPPALRRFARYGKVLPKLGFYLAGIDQDSLMYRALRANFFSLSQRAELYQPDWFAHLVHGAGEAPRQVALRDSVSLDWLSRFQYTDVRVYMPSDILVKVDRTSMLASLEVRSPLLDHRIYEFMARIPPKYKMDEHHSKILFKQALGNLLPARIQSRNKQGFVPPVAQWLRQELRTQTEGLLLSATPLYDYVRPEQVQKWVREHLMGQANHAPQVWALLCLALWMERYGG